MGAELMDLMGTGISINDRQLRWARKGVSEFEDMHTHLMHFFFGFFMDKIFLPFLEWKSYILLAFLVLPIHVFLASELFSGDA